MELGKIIKSGRTKKGLTQDELAKLLGVTKVSIWSWESGRYVPDGKILIRLAEILDIVFELFPEHKPKSDADKKIEVLENKIDIRFSKIEEALASSGIHIENNHGPVNIAGKQHVGNKTVVKK